MDQLTYLYNQMEIVKTASERYEILKSIKAIEKEIESNRDKSPAFYSNYIIIK